MGEMTSGVDGKGWHVAGNYPPPSAVINHSSWFSLKVNGPGFHLIPYSSDLRALLSYWEAQRGDRLIASRDNITADDIRSVLPTVYMVDVNLEPFDLAYRFLGADIVSRSRGDYTGQRLRDLPSQAPPSQIWRLYEAAVVHQSPHVLFVPLINNPSLYVEMLAMPLSCEDHRVEGLLGGISFELAHRPYDRASQADPTIRSTAEAC